MTVTFSATWAPGPKRGRPRTIFNAPADRAVSVVIEGINEYAQGRITAARDVMKKVAGDIETDAKNTATHYTRAMAKSVKPVSEGPDRIRIQAGGPGAPYAPFVELGTRSGRPSIEAIEKWMKRKGIEPRIKSTRKKRPYYDAAVAIQKKIMRSGIPPQPFLFPAFFRHRNAFIDGVRDAIRG